MIGTRIKKLREDKGLNQLELAKLLNISNTTLSQYESGQRTPSDDIKIKLSKTFNVSIDYLLGITDIKNPYKEDIDGKITTIAAHFDGDEFTEEELDQIKQFKEFVKSTREKKSKER